ncbi:MAG: hypothetical protein AAF587_10660 [Bacteroidota bacterium]
MTTTTKIPLWFWIVSGILLVWNIMGVLAYIGQVSLSPEALAAMPEAEQALYEAVPAWVTGAFAIAVFSGLLACVCLLLRKRWAVPAFIISLAAAVIQSSYNFFLSDAIAVMGAGAAIMPTIVLLLCVGQIWFARKAEEEGWIA